MSSKCLEIKKILKGPQTASDAWVVAIPYGSSIEVIGTVP